jgi:hypothetical protein
VARKDQESHPAFTDREDELIDLLVTACALLPSTGDDGAPQRHLGSMDFFVVPAITFPLYYVLVIISTTAASSSGTDEHAERRTT